MAYAVRFPSHRAPIQIVTFKLFSILGEPPEDYQLQNLSLEMGKIIYFFLLHLSIPKSWYPCGGEVEDMMRLKRRRKQDYVRKVPLCHDPASPAGATHSCPMQPIHIWPTALTCNVTRQTVMQSVNRCS